MQSTQPTEETSTDPIWIDYAAFGERFIERAVTEGRILAAVAGIAGRGMTIGPFSLGPAGLAGFVAEGRVGEPEITRHDTSVGYRLTVPLSLALKVVLGGRRLRLSAHVDIALTLHARTADPLLIVIDIPPVEPADVSFVLRARAVDSAGEWLLDPIAGMVQREVANRVNSMLDEPRARRGRVFDIEAIMDGRRSTHRERTRFDWLDYGEFGERFFERIVTRARVLGVVERMAGRPIEVGPLRTGPGRRAEVTVAGRIGEPRVAERETSDTAAGPGEPVSFDLALPVELDIDVRVLKVNHYHAEVEIPLVMTARAADPLLVVIDVPPPAPEDIRLDYVAQGKRAAALGALAGIRKQIVAQVVRVVNDQLMRGEDRFIDVGARLDALAGS